MAYNPRFDLEGRVVIVTGGGKGIGKVYALEFAKAGANVVAADIDGTAAQAVAEAIRGERGKAVGVETDVSDAGSTEEMARATREAFGGIDVLINNASLMSVLPRRSWLEIPDEEWDRVMAVNLRGLFLCCRAVFPVMQERAQDRQHIVEPRVGGQPEPSALHNVEGGRDRLHSGARARGR